MERFLVIRTAGGLPAIEAELSEAAPSQPGPEELGRLIEVAVRYVAVSQALVRYAQWLGFVPTRN
jgi:hypothetical protein